MKISVAFLLAGLLGVGLFSLMHLFQKPCYFPRPTGRYAVGTKREHIFDEARKETLADDPAHPYRELMIQVWYPAEGQLKQHFNTFYSLFNQQVGIKPYKIYSYAQPEAAFVAEKSFPVVLFSPGLGGNEFSSTAHCQELASHGYVVVSVGHTYFCDTEFPDARKTTSKIDEKFKGLTGEQKDALADQFLEIWIADMQFVLDYLEKMAKDRNSFFYNHLVLHDVGMMGHSFGGTVTIHVCIRDPRIRCGIDMDGRLFGNRLFETMKKPCMIMLSSAFASEAEKAVEKRMRAMKISRDAAKEFAERFVENINRFIALQEHDVYKILFHDTEHMMFADWALCSNTNVSSDELDGYKATELVNEYLVNFFDVYLKGSQSALLEGKLHHPEVTFVAKRRHVKDETKALLL